MKKRVLVLLLAVFLLAVSCAQDQAVPKEETGTEEIKHTHTWSSGAVSKPRTCQEDGEMYRVCLECGEIQSAVIKSSAVSHSWDDGKIESKSTRAIGDSDANRVLTCNECGELHTTPIPVEEQSIFSKPITIIIPYSPGGSSYTIAENIKDKVNALNPYQDIAIISKTKKGGDCMGAVEYLLSEVDHSSEVFFFPYEFFYRTDEEAVKALEKIVPVVSVADTPVMLFSKEGRFANFIEFAEEFNGKTIKAGRAQQGASNYRNFNLSALAAAIGAKVEFVDNYPNIESAIKGLDNGDIDVYAAFSIRQNDSILQDQVDAIAVLDDADYLVTDGNSVRIIPNVSDYGYPEAAIRQGYVIAMNRTEVENKINEVVNAIGDAILTSTLKSQLGYILNPAELHGNELAATIEENKKKAQI